MVGFDDWIGHQLFHSPPVVSDPCCHDVPILTLEDDHSRKDWAERIEDATDDPVVGGMGAPSGRVREPPHRQREAIL